MNIKVPFGRSIRVTVTGAIKNGFVIVRGCENLPIDVGTVTLPAAARLVLQKIEHRTFEALDFVPVVDLPQGDALVYMTAIAASSTSANAKQAISNRSSVVTYRLMISMVVLFDHFQTLEIKIHRIVQTCPRRSTPP